MNIYKLVKCIQTCEIYTNLWNIYELMKYVIDEMPINIDKFIKYIPTCEIYTNLWNILWMKCW
jgi:hypothetical protein